jgi:hypothetical protein
VGAAVVVAAGAAGVVADVVRHPSARRRGHVTAGTAEPTATPDPASAPLLEGVLARERTLLADLARAAAATPALVATIAVLRADHEAHAGALSALVTAAGVTPSPTRSAGGAPGAAKAVGTADLIRWEKAAAAAFGSAFATATGPQAAVLASICACEQTHVAWLT